MIFKRLLTPVMMVKKIGIKSLGDEVEENKISINLKAFDNLVKYYEDTNDSEVFKNQFLK